MSILAFLNWFLIGLAIYLTLPIVFCWMLFGVAKWKGWLRDDITPAEIIRRLGEDKP